MKTTKSRNVTGAKGVLFQTLDDQILQLFSPLTSLASLGYVLRNSEPDSYRQFSQCFWSAFVLHRKMRFCPQVLKRPTQNTPRKGTLFGEMVLRHIFEMKYSSDGKILGTLPIQILEMFKSIICFMRKRAQEGGLQKIRSN